MLLRCGQQLGQHSTRLTLFMLSHSIGSCLVGLSAERETSALLGTADPNFSRFDVRLVPCVDGSQLARAFRGDARLVGAAMCPAF